MRRVCSYWALACGVSVTWGARYRIFTPPSGLVACGALGRVAAFSCCHVTWYAGGVTWIGARGEWGLRRPVSKAFALAGWRRPLTSRGTGGRLGLKPVPLSPAVLDELRCHALRSR